ncbi:uncharacterized protein VTP21DRAFT_7672 [Calcarisporiella thermophila]|uniref:uncharacterized protein n=1 Tax=Calcarisporiella thermophila TaxID=911321 RepID=UPI0037443F3B
MPAAGLQSRTNRKGTTSWFLCMGRRWGESDWRGRSTQLREQRRGCQPTSSALMRWGGSGGDAVGVVGPWAGPILAPQMHF